MKTLVGFFRDRKSKYIGNAFTPINVINNQVSLQLSTANVEESDSNAIPKEYFPSLTLGVANMVMKKSKAVSGNSGALSLSITNSSRPSNDLTRSQ